MRSKLQNITSRFIAILMVVGLSIASYSCTDPETTDSTKFALFYAGVTDIGPSMSFNLDGPSYIGGAPSDFAITLVKLDRETCSTNSFTINTTTGAISISDTKDLAVGLYTLSISCRSNGDYYEFSDIVSINMMKPVPDGITVEPNKLTVEYADIIDKESTVELPTAKVKTDGNHISVEKYLIANIHKDGELIKNNDFFKISMSGEISIVRGAANIQPGKYIIDLKLTTAIVDEETEEGIFTNAIEIDVTSKPLSLIYAPNSVRVEISQEKVSVAPTLVGSAEQLVYSIKALTPSNAPVSIDPTTGVIALSANNDLQINDVCEVSVSVTNQYGSADFENVYTMTIVPFINPITEFTYNTPEDIIQATDFEHTVATIVGDEPVFSFVNLPEALNGLKIDKNTGTISAEKGNSIPIGNYTVTVSAKNDKNEKQASVELNVIKNQYYFTYIHWGNNLKLTPIKSYASQHRVTSSNELLALNLPVQESDVPDGIAVKYAIDKTNSSVTGAAQIDAKTGAITFTKGWTNAKVLMILITATTGEGTPGEVTVKTPVFIDCSTAVNGVIVTYTPFVLQVNPRNGGTSASPVISGVADQSKFLMDYRRTFNYYNIGGPAEHKNGTPDKNNTDTFMSILWQAYYKSIDVAAPNYGQRWPLSYYDNPSRLSVPLGYVDADNNCAVKINPNKWKDDNGFANGVMIGQMTFTTDGNSTYLTDSSNKNQVFPIALWFDTKF